MKKYYLLLLLLFSPFIVEAKTVTCTSRNNFTVGKNVYEGIGVTCSEGSTSIFAVTEKNTGYVQNPYNAKEGKIYFLDVVWTGTFDNSVDKLIVDGVDQSQWSFGCEDGCHLSTKEVSPKPGATQPTTQKVETPTTTKKVEVNTTQKSETIHVYWVKFDVNGGKEEIKQEAVEEGKTVTKPSNPTREGYKFKEWQLNGKTYDFNTKITKTITLKAVWEEDSSGKKNISFIKLSGLLAPYEGESIDTNVRVETIKSWTKDIFKVDIKWYRGKDKNKIDELVLTARDSKVEAGYYYQARFTLTPGNGYTLNNTKVYLNKKIVTTIKNELSLEFVTEIYGPIEKGVKSESIIVVDDIFEHIASDEKWEDRRVYYKVNAHDSDGDDVIVNGKNCITLSDNVHFRLEHPICVGGRMNLSGVDIDGYYDVGHNSLGDLYLTSAASAPGTYSTTITLTDEKGRTYSGTITIERGSKPLEPVKISSDDGNVLAEFAGEAMKNWFVHVEELYNKDNGQKTKGDLFIEDLGQLAAITNINIFSEDGEKTNGSFTIKIKLHDELKKYKNFTFVYIYDEETYRMGSGPETVTGYVEGDFLVAKLPHLSTYAIYGNNGKEVKSNSKNIYYFLGVGLLVILGIVIFIITKKKPKKAEKKS